MGANRSDLGFLGEPESPELSAAECRRRLRSARTGRVAWSAPDGPYVFPVTSLWRNGCIVFRTSPDGLLSALRLRTYVAFQIDSVEESEAWSVLVRGVAEAIQQPDDLIELWEDEGLVPRAGGDRSTFIEIRPWTVTGRRYVLLSD